MTDGLKTHDEALWRGDRAVEPLLRVVNASKRYKGVHAIRGLNFDVMPGEVHALVGENGAGKSTLCKAIAGAIALDEGQISINGQPVMLNSPKDALKHGVAMVYQETSLVPTMTVAQNIELGHEKMFMRHRTLNIAAQQLLMSMNFHVDPALYVSTLGTAQKQMVEITRALRSGARIVILDEPTASLSPEEVSQLFNVVENLRGVGFGIIFISHALEESLQIADRVTVLRDGELQIQEKTASLTRDNLVRHMVGRAIDQTHYAAPTDRSTVSHARPVLSVENVTMGTTVKNMSFAAYAGEVVGIAGLIGAGRTETAKIVTGALKRNRLHGGRILLNGRQIRYRVPAQAVRDGLVYMTEDRKREGFFETMSIEENIYLGHLATKRGRTPFVSRRSMRQVAAERIKHLNIRALNPAAKIVELSGGNQQKVTVAKSIVQEPDVLIFDEPTRGVDVASIADIHNFIRQVAQSGKAVIVISSYLPEILAVSDRVLVAREGRMVAELARADATEEAIMYAAIF